MGHKKMNSGLNSFVKKEIKNMLRWFIKLNPSEMDRNIKAIEKELFEQYKLPSKNVPIVFILASPRTGSTMLYQMIAKFLGAQYFSNYVEKNFTRYPLVGTVFEKGLGGLDTESKSLFNRYGATLGVHEPSEATGILTNWFNWEHPTETKSYSIKKQSLEHMENTLGGIASFSSGFIVIKNAWNCFRIQALKNAFPSSRFIWLRRDVIKSSYSILLARKSQGDPNIIWNSASPSNLYEIKKLPYIEQVVQQQYWTNSAVDKQFKKFVEDSSLIEVWYEDIINDPKKVLLEISNWMDYENITHLQSNFTDGLLGVKKNQNIIEDDEFKKIRDYAEIYCPEMIRR